MFENTLRERKRIISWDDRNSSLNENFSMVVSVIDEVDGAPRFASASRKDSDVDMPPKHSSSPKFRKESGVDVQCSSEPRTDAERAQVSGEQDQFDSVCTQSFVKLVACMG